MVETTVRLWLKDQQYATEKLVRQQAEAFQLHLDTLPAELQATRCLFRNRQGGGGDQGLLLPRSMCLDVLKFSGDDLDRWILAITKYFSLLNTLADQRLRIVGFNLEGVATEWFRWMSWNVGYHLLSVCEKVTDIPDSFLISFYIPGVKVNLQHELLVLRPTTLGDAFSLVRIIEARFEAIAKKEKEQIVKKKTNAIIPLQTSPKIKGSLNADEDIGVDEVSSAIDGVFDMGESNVESMEVPSKFGEFSDNKKSVEEVVGVGEALGVGEDDDSGNAATNEGDDAIESGDISILNSLIGYGSQCFP
nr:prolyl oligopeptidase family protein [Tanacetum cinerariifolium]